jgi:hypothetical protein
MIGESRMNMGDDPLRKRSSGAPLCGGPAVRPAAEAPASTRRTHNRRGNSRQTEIEVRLSTELVAVVGAVREVRDLLREDRVLQGRVDDHERRIAAIETRVG